MLKANLWLLRLSLMVVYSYKEELDLDEWISDYANKINILR